MDELLFLTLDETLQIQADMLSRYGGQAGVRDLDLVESAIIQPRMGFGGQPFHKTPPEIAATYLFHLTKNHGFLDGNKRTGAASAVVFLKMNDVNLRRDEDGLERLTFDVAAGQAGHGEAVAFFRERIEGE